jgi:hypothetical protein
MSPAAESAGFWHSSGRAGHGIVPTMPHRLHSSPRTMPMPGSPRGTPLRCGRSGHDVGRRRPIGAVAVLQSASARPRRWGDARTPRRECVTADQKAGAPGAPTAVSISTSDQGQPSAAANSGRQQLRWNPCPSAKSASYLRWVRRWNTLGGPESRRTGTPGIAAGFSRTLRARPRWRRSHPDCPAGV